MTANPERNRFGYRNVDPAQKTELVRGVFDRVARRYDIMNDLMSGGIHRLWKDRFVDLVRPRPGTVIADVAGGTGDIARRLLRAAGGSARIVMIDINEQMLRVGRDRFIDRGLLHDMELCVGNAEALPLPDRSVDLYTIAFGLRNVTHIDTALAEAHRVLRPGGRFACLEFSRMRLLPLRRAYDLYSFSVLPTLGRFVAQDANAYRYLAESIRTFPDQPSLAARMRAVGFERVRWVDLSGGLVAVHLGMRI